MLALPDNIETEVDLDSQPFPSDKDMVKQVKDLSLSEFFRTINEQNLYLENLNDPIK